MIAIIYHGVLFELTHFWALFASPELHIGHAPRTMIPPGHIIDSFSFFKFLWSVD